MLNENNLGASFSVYNNRGNDGEGVVALVWQFENYADLDANNEFCKKYEAIYGDNSWSQFQEAMRDFVISSSGELSEVIPEMSIR